MHERTEILAIKLDAEGALKELTDIGLQLRKVADAKKALEEAYKSGKKTEEEYVRGMIELKTQTQSLNNQQSAYQRTLTASQTLLKQNTGSIEENRARLSGLTAQYIKLSKEERENVEVGVRMQKEIKKLSDDLKEQESAIGNTSRNVGNYKDAIKDAIGGMGGFGKAVEGVGTAIKANPIGLLVTALTLIPSLMKSSGEGADFFAKAMSIVNAIVQEGLKRLVALGGAAVKMMSGDFKGAFIEGKAAVSDFAGSIERSVKAGGDLADRMDALENAESKFTVTQAKANKQIDELLIKAKNRQTSEADRIKLLERAEKIEVQVNQQALKLAKERLALIEEENKIKQGDTDEEIKRVNEQQAKIIDIENQSQNIQEKIQNRKDQLADAAAARQAKRLADAEAANKKAAADELARLERLLANQLDKVKEEKRIQDELAAMDKIAADEEAERIAMALQIDIDAARQKVKIAQEEAAEKAAIKQQEFDVTVQFADAASNLANLFASKNAQLADFQKALTIFRVGLASAEALTKGIAASQDMPFPANLIAMATTIATITANVIQAKKSLETEPPKMAKGGVLKGASHAEGGIHGTGSFAGIEVEGGEVIINKRSSARFRSLLNSINLAGGGRSLMPSNYNASGGIILPDATRSALGNINAQIDYHRLAQVIANVPAPVVVVKEISAGLKAAQVKESRINS
jgi:hypothetical protein